MRMGAYVLTQALPSVVGQPIRGLVRDKASAVAPWESIDHARWGGAEDEEMELIAFADRVADLRRHVREAMIRD